MESTAIFSIDETGDYSGRTFKGQFTVKTLLSRQDQFDADIRRRQILGPNAQDALTALQQEAFMLGQLQVRVIKAPAFFNDMNGLLNCEDFNIVQKIFDECVRLEQERIDSIKKTADSAKKQLIKDDESHSDTE